jgi:hypothetical protein
MRDAVRRGWPASSPRLIVPQNRRVFHASRASYRQALTERDMPKGSKDSRQTELVISSSIFAVTSSETSPCRAWRLIPLGFSRKGINCCHGLGQRLEPNIRPCYTIFHELRGLWCLPSATRRRREESPVPSSIFSLFSPTSRFGNGMRPFPPNTVFIRL